MDSPFYSDYGNNFLLYESLSVPMSIASPDWVLQNNTTLPEVTNTTWHSPGTELDLEETPLFEDYSPALLHFASACCILFILLGIPGNLITIIALFRCKKVRNATAVFIINLSVSDLMFCCFNLPLAASVFYQRAWRHGVFLCRMFPLMRYGLLAVSLFTVLSITINRYVMIGHPTLYPKLYSKRYLGLMVACTWLFGFGALVATWLGQWGKFGLDREVGSCSILPDAEGRSPKVFLFIVAFVIPCLAIVVCYARIFYIVRKTALKSRVNTRSHVTASKASDCSSNQRGRRGKFTRADDSAIGSTSCSTATTTDKSTSDAGCNNNFRVRLDVADPHLLAPPSPLRLGTIEQASDGDDGIDNVSTRSNSFSSAVERKPDRAVTSALTHVASVFRREGRSPRRQSTMNANSVPMPGKMTPKDKKLLKMILVIFASFLICYLPITVSKTFHEALDIRALNIAGYILIYLTTCINPIIYVVMSSEYRQAYKNLLMCRTGAEPNQQRA